MRQVETSTTLVSSPVAPAFFELSSPTTSGSVVRRGRHGVSRVLCVVHQAHLPSAGFPAPGPSPHGLQLQALPGQAIPEEGRALRIETVITTRGTSTSPAASQPLPELEAKARQVNHRLLMIERAGQDCAIETALSSGSHSPTQGGPTTGATSLRDSTRLALAGALGVMVHAVSGFTNKSLRSLVAGCSARTTRQSETYDLRRLRLHGLIERLLTPTPYVTTPEGPSRALLHEGPTTESSVRCSARPTTRTQELRRAIATIDHVIEDYVAGARLKRAA